MTTGNISLQTGTSKLTIAQQVVLFLGSCAAILVSEWGEVSILLPIGAIAIAVAIWATRSSMTVLFGYLAAIILIGLRMNKEEQKVGVPEVIVALIMCYALFYVLYQKFILKQSFSSVPLFSLLPVYVCWVLGIGVISIIDLNTNFNNWFREFLAFSSLFVVPILYRKAAREHKNLDTQLFKFLVIFSIIILAVSVFRVRSTMLQATFLFQTGFARFDIMNGAFMTLLLFTLAGATTLARKPIVMAGSILLAIGALVLTFNRTSWVAMILCLPAMYFLLTRAQRQPLKRVMLWMAVLTIGSVIVAIIIYPFVWTLIRFFFVRFLTSSNVKTDASLLGRYVEWRYVLKQIMANPITGTGFGGQYWLYVWLTGNSMSTGYTHNGILLLLLKGGIVGLTLMSTLFVGFFVHGVKLIRSKYLTPLEHALCKLGLVCIVFLAFQMLTVGIFIHRELIWYLGLIWGYFIVKKEKVDELRIQEQHTELATVRD